MASLTEHETRQKLVNTKLKEAKWPICEKKGEVRYGTACTEIPVDGLQNTATGEGFIDNVLYSDDGKPIAIIESKRTSISPEAGRVQVNDYADALEKKYGFRPIIYMTNGKYIKIDDGIFPTREIQGFHKKDEILRLLNKRNISLDRKGLTSSIANRPYQIEAINKVFENWAKKKSRSLLVLATGTGKTRVACAIAKIILDLGYAYRILFLADQKNLVTQAMEETFTKYLPEYPMAKMIEGNWEGAKDARIVFSTYQSMRNAVNDVSNTEFGIGHFDVIIPDEVHRSIFNKYGELFTYFDALMLGLTATPKDEVEKNTYKVFNIDNNEPTYDYSLVKAVKDGYLRYYRALDRTPEILKMGLKYDELSDEEKEQYEELFADADGNIPEEIDGKMFYGTIINEGTIKAVLNTLFEEGIKTQDGKLGKTIIFAKDHKHAEVILKVFREQYPELCVTKSGDSGVEYCTIIDSQIKYNERLQRSFKTDDKIRVVISVDMMDTGVDIPEVVNLVFFKRVLSKTKFNQMIGRGTRRCEDEEVISPDENYFERKSNDGEKKAYNDKQGFLIFDICGNFEFFSIDTDSPAAPAKVLTNYQKKYKEMVSLYASMSRNVDHLTDKEYQFYTRLGNELWTKVDELNDNYLSVRNASEIVAHFKDKKSWGAITEEEQKDLNNVISYLVSEPIETKSALFVDRVFYQRMSSIFSKSKKDAWSSSDAIYKLAKSLRAKSQIDDVLRHSDDLKYLTSQEFIEERDIEKIDSLREIVKELSKYVDLNTMKRIITDFEDKIKSTEDAPEKLIDFNFTVDDFKTPEEKLKFYILNHLENPFISKVRGLEPLDESDYAFIEKEFKNVLDNEEEYSSLFVNNESLSIFVRKHVEPTQEAKEAFEMDCYNNGIRTESDSDDKRKLPYAKQLLRSVFKNGYLNRLDLLQGPLCFDKRLTSTEIQWLIKRIAEFAPILEV